jgi:hypothetical protein
MYYDSLPFRLFEDDSDDCDDDDEDEHEHLPERLHPTPIPHRFDDPSHDPSIAHSNSRGKHNRKMRPPH